MSKKYIAVLIAIPLLQSCSDSESRHGETVVNCEPNQKIENGTCVDIDGCTPECNAETQKCVSGTCYDINECVPKCDSRTQRCVKGTCIANEACAPACDAETQKCVNGVCYGIDECVPKCNPRHQRCVEGVCIGLDECYPACDPDTQQCVDGTCQKIDPTVCAGKMCKNKDIYCDDTNHWASCESGFGCHLGYCVEGLAPECEGNTCSADGSQRCDGGTWVSCGSLEHCEDGACVMEPELTCDPGTCSEDGHYRCTDEQSYQACPSSYKCENGECVAPQVTGSHLLWQLCISNSDCARGVCVFDISTSRTMSVSDLGLSNVDQIPVSLLDVRIPEGYGVCSQDCTRNTSICDEISTSNQKFTCQVMITGNSPYPPKDELGMERSLPFHSSLDIAEMEIAPYASLCRPNDMEEKAFSKKFCRACTSSSECGNQESCILGSCLPQCAGNETCPIGFSCKQPLDMETTFCMPNSETCDACLDRDHDGQGFGDCTLKGFDCDDLRNDVYYNKPLDPDTCTDTFTDDNCNGYIDYTEQIGTSDNCETCGTSCKTDPNATNIKRECALTNDGKLLDDSTPTTIAETYIYTCEDFCTEGYADCDGDVSNGCETKLFDITEDGIQLTDDAEMYSIDKDNDGHGYPDANYQTMHFCCKSDLNVCYARPNTDTNAKSYWDRAVLNPDMHYSTQIDDCDDNNSNIYPGNKEICDGLDNDCNPETPDGNDSFVKVSNYQYVTASESDSNRKKLADKCETYHPNNHTTCSTNGKISCVKEQDSYKMLCVAEVAAKDDNCNGIDDNCNGQIDEGYVLTSCSTGREGICSLGVKVCVGANNEQCKQLYQPRDFDFYGDGVDSNCDGYDWDVNHTIFVEKYQNANFWGLDSHSGLYKSPVASLSKAFEKAKNTINGKTVYSDIIVSNAVTTSDTNDGNPWGKTQLRIPIVPVGSRYNPNLRSAISKEDHINYYKNNPNYNPNQYLYPGEIYPGTEVIRIYGGFSHSGNNVWAPPSKANEFSKYFYQLTSSNTSYSSIASGVNALDSHLYEMIRPATNDGPMSLLIRRFKFSFGVQSLFSNLTGTTLVGLTCGKAGCDRLVLQETPIAVSAPDGYAQDSTHPENDIWSNEKDGVAGNIWETFDEKVTDSDYLSKGGGDIYGKTNYKDNNCMSHYFVKNNSTQKFEWHPYTDYKNIYGNVSYYDVTCPDGKSPRGGCAGTFYCKNIPDGSSYQRADNGKEGKGPNPGSGAWGMGCETQWVDAECGDSNVNINKPAGRYGGNGRGGYGGKNTDLSIKPFIDSNANLYMATYSGNKQDSVEAANGEAGVSGGGGGGGGVYMCYDMNGAWDRWVHGGTGGAGGCGGYGGKAGGSGGSAIGLVLIPPKDRNGYFDVDLKNDNAIEVAGAVGGAGTAGQDGKAGGKGGHSVGYRYNTHCIKATAGGAGGAGGGGGAGAGGLAGHAYGYVFVCNRNVTFDSTDHLNNCGFTRSDSFNASMNNIDKVKVSTAQDYSNGANGTAGSWPSSNDNLQGVDKDADRMSTAGKGASASSSANVNGNHKDAVRLIKTTAF